MPIFKETYNLRKRIFTGIIVAVSFILSLQLFKMQILEYSFYDKRSKINSIKKIEVDAPRGVFFDRNMEMLVSNKPSFTLQIIPDKFDMTKIPLIENVIKVDSGYIKSILYKKRKYSKFVPRKIKRGISLKTIAWLEEQHEFLPGVNYVIELQRDYSFGIKGSHIFGYTKEITAARLKKYKGDYLRGDEAGASGLEMQYENLLRGIKGKKYIVVDSKRKTIGSYLNGERDVKPIKGNDLVLTLDKQTQQIAESLMVKRKGAIVAIEPATGEILAFVSAPEYDLSLFASITSGETLQKLFNNPDKALFNRATMSIYPPGSTVKMIAALAALEDNIVTKNWRINCGGGYQLGDRFFGCTHVHGKTNMVKSIEESCNTYYYQLILKLGIDRWSNFVSQFGFGRKTGIDIPEESGGILPDRKYFNKIYGKNRWTEGYLLNIVIGQGQFNVTPVQLAQYVSLLANNGRTKTPHFLRGYINRNGELHKTKYDDVIVDISTSSLDVIKTGMYDVVNKPEGTAFNIHMKELKIAGKTGTSQNPFGKDHSVFIAYAPFDNPKIAVAVVVENAGYGSATAAPIARDIITTYLLRKTVSPKYPVLINKTTEDNNEN
ncbi:MAG: penicillin-binding protein 2 [Chlorobi bacterium]|nr:penicillin-binding protein 2 [Chlorobiota bacterium]